MATNKTPINKHYSTLYKQEAIKPYSNEGEKTRQVEAMFNNIAPTYDKLNHRLSWDIDRIWRRKAIRMLKPHAPQHMLDIATGTGDFAIMAAQMLHPARLIGTDISENMMKVGKEKVAKAGLQHIIQFEKEDCMQLSYPSESFDAVTAAFGIRNFSNLEQGLSEMCRVLRKGGHLCIAELTTPVIFPMKQLFAIYSHTVLPLYGRAISKDISAYSYHTYIRLFKHAVSVGHNGFFFTTEHQGIESFVFCL